MKNNIVSFLLTFPPYLKSYVKTRAEVRAGIFLFIITLYIYNRPKQIIAKISPPESIIYWFIFDRCYIYKTSLFTYLFQHLLLFLICHSWFIHVWWARLTTGTTHRNPLRQSGTGQAENRIDIFYVSNCFQPIFQTCIIPPDKMVHFWFPTKTNSHRPEYTKYLSF